MGDFFEIASKRLDHFDDLEDGWFYGRGKAPVDKHLQICREALNLLEKIGYQSIDFALGESGQISFMACHEAFDVEVVITLNNLAKFYIDVDGGPSWDYETSTEHVLSVLKSITPTLCIGSEFYLPTSSIETRSASAAQHSATARVAEFQSSISNVLLTPAVTFVDISECQSMNPLQATRQFSGLSNSQRFPPTASSIPIPPTETSVTIISPN